MALLEVAAVELATKAGDDAVTAATIATNGIRSGQPTAQAVLARRRDDCSPVPEDWSLLAGKSTLDRLSGEVRGWRRGGSRQDGRKPASHGRGPTRPVQTPMSGRANRMVASR
jgi:hypothetical protein